MTPGGDLTPDERAHVAPYVTDPVGPVFALVNLPEAVKGALFARYSRTAKSLRRILLEEFMPGDGAAAGPAGAEVGTGRARDFFARVLTDYGDDSVAQLGGAHVAIEGASNVLTKVIEWGRLASYLEQSTRYVPYTDRPGGRWKYVRPAAISADPSLLAAYEDVLDDAFATYARLNTAVHDDLVARFPVADGDAAAARALRAQALDAVRGLLPAATTANLGVYASGQAWESLIIRLRAHPLAEARKCGDRVLTELRTVIPDFLTRVDRPDRGERHGAYRQGSDLRAADLAVRILGEADEQPDGAAVRLIESDPDGEARVLAHALWPSSGMPLGEVRARVREMAPADRTNALATWAAGRADRRERPGRALEATSYLFEIVCDYGAYRDLQRHRLLTLEVQPLGAALGWEPSPDVESAGLADEFARVQQRAGGLWRDLLGVVPDEAPYAVTMAHRLRFTIRMNAREAMHLIELRSQPQGHAAYRRVAQDMLVAIRDDAGHGAIADMMSFVDTDDATGRLAQERRVEARQDGSDADDTVAR